MDTYRYGVLSPLAFGLALGLLWAISIVVLAIMASFLGYGIGLFNALSSLYIGLSLDVVGVLIGAVLGFVDAFIGGVIWAYLYNFFVKRV